MGRPTLLVCVLVIPTFLFAFTLPISTAPAPFHRPAPQAITNTIGMKLLRIPPGKFLIGSSRNEKGHQEDEEPQHEVEIKNAFYLGCCAVTQKQFKDVMGYNPSYFSRNGEGKAGVMYDVKPAGGKDKVPLETNRFPVENVNWFEAVAFCAKLTTLSKDLGWAYRLPTEAEWEYACRANTTTRYYTGNDEDGLKKAAWYAATSKGRPHSVGEKMANPWGLYDMHGNVWQWCSDWYSKDSYRIAEKRDQYGPKTGEHRVLRGGSYSLSIDAVGCRAAYRTYYAPGDRAEHIGFRAVCIPSHR